MLTHQAIPRTLNVLLDRGIGVQRVALLARIVWQHRYGGACNPSDPCKKRVRRTHACAVQAAIVLTHCQRLQSLQARKAQASHTVSYLSIVTTKPSLAEPSTSKELCVFVTGRVWRGRGDAVVGRGLLAVPCRILLQRHRQDRHALNGGRDGANRL